MSNAENISIGTANSSDSTATESTQAQKVTLNLDLATLASRWSTFPRELQQQLWRAIPEVPPIINSLIWMQRHTRTRDDQDQNQSYKRFPKREYLRALHKVWIVEPFLFIEKSRTMMCSWWGAAETLHYGMTHQPSTTIYWAQDQDRAIALLDYAKVLYAQQDAILKSIFPLARPLERQSFDKLELKDGGIFIALPGTDPDKIRSLHPTQLVMDECCFIENGAEAFDVAISSRVPKVLCISSAAPSWFRRMTKDARPISLESYL